MSLMVEKESPHYGCLYPYKQPKGGDSMKKSTMIPQLLQFILASEEVEGYLIYLF
jgi:hypothetical protein